MIFFQIVDARRPDKLIFQAKCGHQAHTADQLKSVIRHPNETMVSPASERGLPTLAIMAENRLPRDEIAVVLTEDLHVVRSTRNMAFGLAIGIVVLVRNNREFAFNPVPGLDVGGGFAEALATA